MAIFMLVRQSWSLFLGQTWYNLGFESLLTVQVDDTLENYG